MMKLFATVIIFLLILIACGKEKKVSEIVITGFIENCPDGKVFLTHAHDSNEIIDSTKINKGHFRFVLKANSSFTPFLASIHYRETNNNVTSLRKLIFHNPFQSKDNTQSATDSYFQGKENTTITGNQDSLFTTKVIAGKENRLYQKFVNKGFGSLGSSTDSTKRLARLKFFKKTVSQNPYSYYLLTEVFYNKEAYAEEDLKSLLALFSLEVRSSVLGNKFKAYFANRPDVNKPYANLQLVDSNNKIGKILAAGAKVNLLIFWASWCGPCRNEIPDLKKINLAYKTQGLSLVSISIDKKASNWQKALSQENMNWQQFIVPENEIEMVQQKFNFSAIPFMLLTDASGKEILKINGYHPDNVENIITTLNKYLSGE